MSRNQTYIVLILLAMVVLAWSTAPLLGSRHASLLPLSQSALQFNGSQALQRTSEFVAANPKRVVGSLEARQSSGYIQQHLKALGYSIAYSHFDAIVAGRKEVGRNIIGFRPGADPGIIAVVAHYDTAPTTVQGAMDNGSGVGVMLELARIFAAAPAAHAVAFIGSDGNEYGMLGAKDLALNYPERERLAAVLSLDYVAIGDLARLELCTSGQNAGFTPPWLRDVSRRAVNAEPVALLEPFGFQEHLQRALLFSATDQGPFLAEGIPSINLASRSQDPEQQQAVYHSAADTPGGLKPESLGTYGRVAERILRTLDEASPLPRESMGAFRVRDAVYLSETSVRLLQLLTFVPLAAVFAFYIQNHGRHLGRGILRRELAAAAGALLPFAAFYYTIAVCRGLRLTPRFWWYTAKSPVLEQPRWGVLLALLVVAGGVAIGLFYAVRYLNRTLTPAEFHVSKLVLLGLLLTICLLAFWYNSYWAVTFLSLPAIVWALTGAGEGTGGRAANRIVIAAAGAVYYMVALHYAAHLALGWKLVWLEVLALSSGVFSLSAFLLAAAACAVGIRFLVIQAFPRSG